MGVVSMESKEDRPSLVMFERRPLEDRAASIAANRYVAKDVDHALITAPGTRDKYVTTVKDWMKGLDRQVREGRIPVEWKEKYLDSYERWKRGEEIPVNGTPIKGWGMISPAQQTNLIAISVVTVEDLARLNDEGMRRLGIGAADLKNKAVAWLAQLDDKGPLVQEVATLKAENASLKKQVESLTKKVEALSKTKAK